MHSVPHAIAPGIVAKSAAHDVRGLKAKARCREAAGAQNKIN